jgi:hypothetical protein
MKKDYEFLKFCFRMIYSSGVTFGAFIFFFKVVFSAIPEDNVQNAGIILGFLMGSALTVFIQYFFGSSQSSSAMAKRDAEKDPVAEAAKCEAARLEAERIDAAKIEAEKKEAARLQTAKEEAAKVIEKAKEEINGSKVGPTPGV